MITSNNISSYFITSLPSLFALIPMHQKYCSRSWHSLTFSSHPKQHCSRMLVYTQKTFLKSWVRAVSVLVFSCKAAFSEDKRLALEASLHGVGCVTCRACSCGSFSTHPYLSASQGSKCPCFLKGKSDKSNFIQNEISWRKYMRHWTLRAQTQKLTIKIKYYDFYITKLDW